jgi:hypothetical protein
VRGKSRAVLLTLAFAAVAPSPGRAQYTPRWHVGDWWIVKVWEPDLVGGMRWRPHRYDVLRVEKAAGADCFLLQHKVGDTTPSVQGDRSLYYVRTDNYRVIRKVEYIRQAGKIVGPRTFDYPEGLFGPDPLHPRVPQLPLGPAVAQDTMFRDCGTTLGWASLRQSSGLADSALLKRYLSGPNQSGGRPVPPRCGEMFFALSEEAAPREPGGPAVPLMYSFQIWSEDYPWRLYEEDGLYAPDGTRLSRSRGWLIAWGRIEGR